MRVLFLTNQLDIGGIEKNIVRLTREFTTRGHEVHIGTRSGALLRKALEAGGRHLDLRLSTSPPEIWRDGKVLARFLTDQEVDVVHAFSAPAAILVAATTLMLRAQRKRVPFRVSSIMGLTTTPEEPRWITKLRAWTTSLGSQKLLVISPAIDKALRGLPISRRRRIRADVVGVELPSDLSAGISQREDVRKEMDLSGDETLVLTVGRLHPSKSHDLFVAAAASVAAVQPNARFGIVGSGPLGPQLERQIHAAGLDETISLLGTREDVDRLLAATDVYVRPGIVEGFVGITVLEAQAWGVPVVSFETEDVKLAIDHGRTGVLVPNGDVTALSAAILGLLNDRQGAARMGAAGREHVRSRFSIETIASALERLYQDGTGTRK